MAKFAATIALIASFPMSAPHANEPVWQKIPWKVDRESARDLWGCNRLSTPALRKSQAEIRQRFTGAELKQYARLRRLKPFCVYEDTPATRGSPARGLAAVIRDIRTRLDRDRPQSPGHD